MKNMKSSTLLLTATAGVMLALTGCASDSGNPPQGTDAGVESPAAQIKVPDASEIFPKTADTVEKATSVALDSDLTNGDQNAKVNISGTKDGSNSRARITMDGGTMEMLTVDGTSYVKGDKAFFAKAAGEKAAQMLTSTAGDKWISTKDASMFGNFKVGTLLESMGTDDLNAAEAAKVSAKSLEELDGVKAFKYTGDETIYWIAAEGEPYLLQVKGTGSASDASGHMAFSNWNSAPRHEAPAKSETISVPGL